MVSTQGKEWHTIVTRQRQPSSSVSLAFEIDIASSSFILYGVLASAIELEIHYPLTTFVLVLAVLNVLPHVQIWECIRGHRILVFILYVLWYQQTWSSIVGRSNFLLMSAMIVLPQVLCRTNFSWCPLWMFYLTFRFEDAFEGIASLFLYFMSYDINKLELHRWQKQLPPDVCYDRSASSSLQNELFLVPAVNVLPHVQIWGYIRGHHIFVFRTLWAMISANLSSIVDRSNFLPVSAMNVQPQVQIWGCRWFFWISTSDIYLQYAMLVISTKNDE